MTLTLSKPTLWWLAIMLATIIAYSNSLGGGLVMDDGWVISQSHLEPYLDSPPSLFQAYRPRTLANYTFAANYALHGLETFGYHLVNLLIHLTNLTLVVILSSQLLKMLTKLPRSPRMAISLLGALLWGLHPINTMAVSYITGRYSLLGSMFYLLGVMAFVKLLGAKSVTRRILWLSSIMAALVLGITSKEIVATLPLLCLLVLVIQGSRTKQVLGWGLLLTPVVATLGLLTFRFYNWSFIIGPKLSSTGETINWYEYALTQWHVWLVYLSKLMVPLQLTGDYDLPIASSLWSLPVVIGLVVWLGLIGTGIYLRSRERFVSLAIGWLLITPLIDGSIFPIADVANEYRLYLPSLGFAWIVSWMIFKLSKANYDIARVVVLAVLVVYMSLTYSRNFVYQSNLHFWEDVVIKSPAKARGYVNIGQQYHASGQVERAMEAYSQALKIDPKRVVALSNLAIAYLQLNQIAEARTTWNQALMIDDGHVDSLNGLGVLELNFGSPQLAVEYFTKALEIEPDNQPAKDNLTLAQLKLAEER